uniref:Mitochondrial genome maintenance exonuclease 1, DNA complex, DNA exonuclease n=1 Tax=Podoviridae sp. ct5cR14 TaxID=2825220 RepID=A0A8S5PQ78_9CAUD|nr:MAG TPA: Mitochondrial genome maintenance exonuclease 1, DNA complex, DNA exonuclease [Podoviridae sp. ct5cR14]
MTAETKKITLNVPIVTFIEESHQYFIGKKELKGVTGTLIKKAFPDTYKNIPESVLKKAAERGGLIHNTFETFCSIFDADIKQYPNPTEELQAFHSMLVAYDLHYVASEYLVTDGENFASAIDGIFADNEGNIYLVDYKTTATLHYDNVSLQLSIYAKWFEEQNPDLKVKEIVCMWFKNGQSKFQPLPRVADYQIDDLINAYLADDADYQYKVEVPEQFSALEQEYRLITARMDALKIKQDDVKEQIMKMMEANKQKSIKTNIGSYSYVESTTKRTLDTKLFKEKYPNAYERLTKVSISKPSIRIKLN